MWVWTMTIDGRSVTAFAASIASPIVRRLLPSVRLWTCQPRPSNTSAMSAVNERLVAPARQMRLES